jgi:hypothetical protein
LNGNRKYLIRTILISSAIVGGSLLNINSASAAPGPKPIVKAAPAPAPAPKPAPIPVLIAQPTPQPIPTPTSPPPPANVTQLPSFMPWTVAPTPTPKPSLLPIPIPQGSPTSKPGLSTLNKVEVGVIAVAASVALIYSIAEITAGITVAASADLLSSIGQGGVFAGIVTSNPTFTYTSGIVVGVSEIVNRVMK